MAIVPTKAIVDILKDAEGKPLTTMEVHAKVKDKIEAERSENSTRNDLKWLQELGIVERVLHPEEDKIAWVHVDYSKRKLAETRATLDYQARIIHTSDLKEIIRKWIEQLPYPDTRFYWKNTTREMPIFNGTVTYWVKSIPIENNPLFIDLKKHLPFYTNLSEEWEEFKTNFIDFETKKHDLLKSVASKVSKKLKMPISPNWEINTISTHLPSKVCDILLHTVENNKKFIKDSFMLEKRIEEDTESFAYWVGGEGQVRIGKDKKTKEALKNEMDAYWENIHNRKLRSTKDINLAKEIVSMKKKLEKMRENIMKALEKNLMVPIFPGVCDFL